MKFTEDSASMSILINNNNNVFIIRKEWICIINVNLQIELYIQYQNTKERNYSRNIMICKGQSSLH